MKKKKNGTNPIVVWAEDKENEASCLPDVYINATMKMMMMTMMKKKNDTA